MINGNRKFLSGIHFKKLALILLLPIGAFLSYVTSFAPSQVESMYSNSVYKVISQVLSFISGLVPLSLAELFMIIIPLFLLYKLVQTIMKVFKAPHGKLALVVNYFTGVIAFGCTMYFAFVLLWGMNYNREPFSQIASLEVKPSSVAELSKVCEDIVNRANSLRQVAQEDKNGVMTVPGGYVDIFQRAGKGYKNASKLYPELGGYYNRPKGIIFSKAMSYAGISGIYSPFTSEANVDIDMPYLMIPSTACHEMAHQRGFAREDEANYIAYLTCRLHSDTDFQYSGTVLALIYCTNALYGSDKDEYKRIRSKFGAGLIRDLRNHSEYWKGFEGPVGKTADRINNAYLKANRQEDGVKSYGRMVDLILAEYRKYGGN